MKKKAISPQQKAHYAALLDTHPEIEMKGKNMLYTSRNGHMFSVFSTDAKLGIRLGKEDRKAFLEKYNTTLLHSYGAVMREYVTVPDDLLAKTNELKPYLYKSFEYVNSLEPKPTTKKK